LHLCQTIINVKKSLAYLIKNVEKLYSHNLEMFTESENWLGKVVEQSLLIVDFSTFWKLKDIYNKELSQLAFLKYRKKKM
jgi:hypothetical protein